MGAVDAANRFGYKRKKKHMFNEAGVPIEPFNIRDDVQSGLMTEDGFLKRSLQQEGVEERDPWLDTIREDQEKRLREEQQKAQDS
jgi:hypothetical protein